PVEARIPRISGREVVSESGGRHSVDLILDLGAVARYRTKPGPQRLLLTAVRHGHRVGHVGAEPSNHLLKRSARFVLIDRAVSRRRLFPLGGSTGIAGKRAGELFGRVG